MLKCLRSILLISACAFPVVSFVGCDVNEGPSEEFAEEIDDAADDLDE